MGQDLTSFIAIYMNFFGFSLFSSSGKRDDYGIKTRRLIWELINNPGKLKYVFWNINVTIQIILLIVILFGYIVFTGKAVKTRKKIIEKEMSCCQNKMWIWGWIILSFQSFQTDQNQNTFFN